MSATPRTDALTSVPMTRRDSDDFARQLERELAACQAARRDEESWWKERHDYKDRAEKAEAAVEAMQREKARLWFALERLCQIAEFRGLVVGPQDARKVLAEIKS